MKIFRCFPGLLALLFAWLPNARADLSAGAATIDITPTWFPVLVNGGMLSDTADRVTSPLHARAIVLDDGRERLAIVVVDSCMMPRPFLDEAKALAAQRTRIRPERMLISATHTHSAPAAMSCLGTEADPRYVPFLRIKLAEVIAAAEANLVPARVGWASAEAPDHTALRRWIRRPDRLGEDPFGNPTVRANMHAGRHWDDVIGESGPEDPTLSLIAIQSLDGLPLAVLANFSMHYFGDTPPLSADYFGLFSEGLKKHLEPPGLTNRPPFVGILSHGCSGDIWRRDYTLPPDATREPSIAEYTESLLRIALAAHQTVPYEDADLAMSEARLTLNRRVPDRQRLDWARRVIAGMEGRSPTNVTEVYAREQILLHEQPTAEVVVQAVRIGEIGIATTPTETYALTGWKVKLQSPLPQTMVFDLANGADGYIPPPEQHRLGGYNTWPARSAGLEIQAEPRIAQLALEQLEKVAGRPRRQVRSTQGPAARMLLQAAPLAYWRLDEMSGPRAIDTSGHQHHAFYEPGVVFYLEGPRSDAFTTQQPAGAAGLNRAAHFAGGRLDAYLDLPAENYSISLWFWNGLPTDAREIAGWIYSRGHDHGLSPDSEHLGLGGTSHSGQLTYLQGDPRQGAKPVAGHTVIPRWTWNQVVLVREEKRVRVHLNGDPLPEIEVLLEPTIDTAIDTAPALPQLFFGGRNDHHSNWEGRLDEIAVFDRALTTEEILGLYPGNASAPSEP
jgi:hypothetical protein